MAQADEFTVDAPIAPSGVLGRQAEDESACFGGGRWLSRWSGRLCPVAGDASSVPSQQSVGRDKPAMPAGPGERGCDRTEQGPVVIV